MENTRGVIVEFFKICCILVPSFYFYRNKINSKNKSILILLMVITSVCSNILNSYGEGVIAYIVLSTIYLYLFQRSEIEFILVFILFYLTMVMIGVIQGFILLTLVGMSYDYIVNTTYIKFIISINIFIINFTIGVLLKRSRKEKNNKSINIVGNKRSIIIIAINMVIVFLITFMIIAIIKKNLSKNILDNIYLMGFVIIFFTLNLITCYMVIYYSNKESVIKQKTVELETLKEYIEFLEDLNTEVRKFRHDYINMLATMSEYIEAGNIIDLKRFFETNILPLSRIMNKKNLRLGLLGNIKIPELKGLLAYKVIKAQEIGVKVYIDVPEPIIDINLDLIDMARIVGIIMDNAIEAAILSEKKVIKVGLFEKKKSVILVVSNSYIEEEIYLHEIIKQGFSTKGQGRGLGLNILYDTISKYNNVVIDTIIEEEFIQNIQISQ